MDTHGKLGEYEESIRADWRDCRKQLRIAFWVLFSNLRCTHTHSRHQIPSHFLSRQQEKLWDSGDEDIRLWCNWFIEYNKSNKTYRIFSITRRAPRKRRVDNTMFEINAGGVYSGSQRFPNQYSTIFTEPEANNCLSIITQMITWKKVANKQF